MTVYVDWNRCNLHLVYVYRFELVYHNQYVYPALISIALDQGKEFFVGSKEKWKEKRSGRISGSVGGLWDWNDYGGKELNLILVSPIVGLTCNLHI